MDPSKFQQSDPGSVAAGHELSDVRIRGIVVFGVILTIGTAVAMVLLWAAFELMLAHDEQSDPTPSVLARRRSEPVGPQLEKQPGVSKDKLYQAQTYDLEHYGWVDKNQQIVRLPIAAAMELFAEELAQPKSATGAVTQPGPAPGLEMEQPPLEDVEVAPGSGAQPAGEPTS